MINNISTAEHYWWDDICEGWRLLDRPDLSVIQERIPPGAGEVKHYHQRARQLFFVLSGNLEIELGSHSFQLSAGDSIEVSPASVHQVHNTGDSDASFLVISAPTTRDDRTNLDP
jgi:mannose-6-phosphate isomerase-like protein (cupin superfamily)